jgi:hypothetical protein
MLVASIARPRPRRAAQFPRKRLRVRRRGSPPSGAAARGGRTVPVPLRYGQVHRLPVLRGGLLRAERQPDGVELAAGGRNRRRRLSVHAAVLPLDRLQPLSRCGMFEGLPGGRVPERSSHRDRAAQRGSLHRLPVLHLELPLRRAAVQPRAGRGGQVRPVLRAAGGIARPGLRGSLPRDRDSRGTRQYRRMAPGFHDG